VQTQCVSLPASLPALMQTDIECGLDKALTRTATPSAKRNGLNCLGKESAGMRGRRFGRGFVKSDDGFSLFGIDHNHT
jgi:hypothetical protein